MKNLSLILLLLIGVTGLFGQEIRICGQVLDESMSPLAGVTVLIKNTTKGILTDANGKFCIPVPGSEKVTLVFSYLGMGKQEIEAAPGNFLNVKMTSDNVQLDEVVVVGYSSGIRIRLPRRSKSENTYSPQPIATQFSIPEPTGESYKEISENKFVPVTAEPLSTFSVDVDKAGYSNVRRFLNEGQKPPVDAVRIEELINYFDYEYPQPVGEHPMSVNTEVGQCPWNTDNLLMLVGLQGKIIPIENLPASNLVFLIDVSGSMEDDNKLPLLKQGLKLLVENLREKDRVSIVVYAGAAGEVLSPTSGDQKEKILSAINSLQSGGSTAGGAGIELAYNIAEKHFIKNGNNRVILATDGDFNVGVTEPKQLEKLIEEKRQTGVFLTCLGFGSGNYQDDRMEMLADKGNGNYAYIDNLQEAQRVLSTEFGGTLFTIAKDVKIQVEFNPTHVAGYRLLGYENRLLEAEDFEDDHKDAGEIGSGHTVTALYEIIPTGVQSKFLADSRDLKYQQRVATPGLSQDLATIKFRYKAPKDTTSVGFDLVVKSTDESGISSTSENLRFASSVALFGMLLRDSPFANKSTWDLVLELAQNAKSYDPEGYRGEFIRLVKLAKGL